MQQESDIITVLSSIVNDRGVPKNVKGNVEEALKILEDASENNVKVAEAVSILDEVTTDPNLSFYTRTLLWDAVSKLEAMK